MHLPKRFDDQLPKNHFIDGLWFKTTVKNAVGDIKCAFAFDVLSLLVAMQDGDDVSHARIEYEMFNDCKTIEDIFKHAINLILDGSIDVDETSECTTIESLANDEYKLVDWV